MGLPGSFPPSDTPLSHLNLPGLLLGSLGQLLHHPLTLPSRPNLVDVRVRGVHEARACEATTTSLISRVLTMVLLNNVCYSFGQQGTNRHHAHTTCTHLLL